jgi:hypothetical protein
MSLGVDSGQPGLWWPSGAPFCLNSPSGLTAQRSWFGRLPCPRSMTITKMAFFVTTAAAADDACDVGIYAVNGTAVNLLSSSGSTLGKLNSTGLKQVNLQAAVALVAGQIYYVAFAMGAAGGSVASLQSTCPHPFLTNMFITGASVPQIEQSFNNANFPLAAAPAVSGPISCAPILALIQ